MEQKIEKPIGYLTKCIRCGRELDIWTWEEGDPIPNEMICDDCLTPEESEEFAKYAK